MNIDHNTIMTLLSKLWKLRPNLEFCQLLDFVLALAPNEDIFNISNEELIEKLYNHIETFENTTKDDRSD